MKTKSFFENVRVADFTWMGVGSTTTKYLAEYGAQIIKIESRTRPDPMRLLTPFKDGIRDPDRSHLWADLNVNKYSIAVNLRNPKGVELAKRIVAVSDVVSESFSPGSMERLGLGYADLKAVKPDIIMMSTSLEGRGGPFSAIQGGGNIGASMGGFNHITGWPDRPPPLLGIPYSDFIAPLFGAALLHAALDYRRRTGKGQYFDLSQCEGAIQFFIPLLLDFSFNGRITERPGNTSAACAPHGVYRCTGEDDWCAIVVTSDTQWRSLCRVIGSQALSTPKYATVQRRLRNSRELDPLIESWTGERTSREVMNTLQASGIPAGLVAKGKDILEDPQLRYYPAYCELDHPQMGRHIGLRRGPEFSKLQYEVRRSPLLAEHNEWVCKEVLRMSHDEFEKLTVEHVLE